MALLFIDGFDQNSTSFTAHATKYGTTDVAALSTTVVRTGSGAASFSTGNQLMETKALSASGAAIVGMARRWTAAFNATDILQIREGSTIHMAVGTVATGELTVKRGTTVLQTGTTIIPRNSWVYIEFKTVIDDTAGSYELRVDGVTELSATGVDTRNAGTTGQWDRVRLIYGSATTGNGYLDDLYVCDGSGSAPLNDFLGVCKVETLIPQTDAVAAGSNAGLTPSTGTDHGALVDDVPANTTDYNSSPTVGVKDTYQFPSLSLTGTVLGVQTNLYVAKSDAAARQVCAVVRSGGTDYDGANISPTTTFSYFSEVRALDPNTGLAWTSGAIASLEAGMKVTA